MLLDEEGRPRLYSKRYSSQLFPSASSSMSSPAFLSPAGFVLHGANPARRTECRVSHQQRLAAHSKRHAPAAAPPRSHAAAHDARASAETRTCVRCGATFLPSENAAGSCRYHGDVLGTVQTLNLYEDHHFDDEALDGVKGPRYGRRWACCQDTDPDAPPCKSGVHVTYDCGPEQWTEGLKFEVR